MSRDATAFMGQIESLPEGELAVLDLYAEHRDAAPTHQELAEKLRAALAGVQVPGALHRIVIAVAEPRRGRGMSAIDLFTFRPGPDGLAEDEVLRGLHPMMGHRLQVWRLQEFELERLPSAEDIYTFRGVAHTNPKDERLFALAEVRDLTRIYDDEGHVVALPELEQVVVRVLATLRSFQARRPLSRRLLWNRVLLHVWPVMEPDPDEIHRLVERLAPLTTGLGIEMISFQGQVREPDGVVRRRVLQFFTPLGHDVSLEVADPPKRPIQPLDEGARRLISARRRGTLHPAEVVRLLAPVGAIPGQPDGIFTEHELTDDGELVPVDRAAGDEPVRDRRRHGPQLHRALSGGNAARDPARRPDAGARGAGGAGVPADHRRDRPRGGAWRAARVVRTVGRGEDRDGQRDRDDGLDRSGAAQDRAVHAGGRRAQRRRGRDQRRRAAVLERRGDDADAHPRGADHDA